MLIEIYRRKREGDGANLEFVVKELLRQLSEDQIAHFLPIVSEELKITQDKVDVRLTLQILPSDLWPRLDEAARLRTENLLINSIEEGKAANDGKVIKGAGALGTWARDFLKYFSLKSAAGQAILEKLKRDEPSQQYVFNFFLRVLPDLYDTSYRKDACVVAIAEAVEAEFGDSLMRKLKDDYWHFPEDWKNLLKRLLPVLKDYEEDIPF